MSNTRRGLAALLAVSCTLTALPLRAHADMVSTDEVVQSQTQTEQRERVLQFFSREDVRQALHGQGVDPRAAQARVDALSDAEVDRLARQIDSAPAGGEVLGLLFTVFVILLVTDILGLTKVFPFTRSVR